jgi:surfeit locus 1 family protein
VAIVGLLAFAALFTALARWQLHRADETRTLAAKFAAAAALPALEHAPDEATDDLRFRRVALRGSYLPGRQFLLDNRIRDGVVGYEVLTPLKLADDHRWLVVNRGWLPGDLDRRKLPDIAVGAGDREVVGRIERMPRPGIRLGSGATAGAGSRAEDGTATVVVYPTSRELGELVGEPLLDYELLLDEAAPDGFVREWRAPGLAIERHLAYAGQWAFLAIGALGAGIAIAIRAAKRARAGDRS